MRPSVSLCAIFLASVSGLRLHATTRRDALKFAAASIALPSLVEPTSVVAGDVGPAKRTNLSPAEMAAAVKADIVERQFLVTGALSRELYDESCMFKDEIDTCVQISKPNICMPAACTLCSD